MDKRPDVVVSGVNKPDSVESSHQVGRGLFNHSYDSTFHGGGQPAYPLDLDPLDLGPNENLLGDGEQAAMRCSECKFEMVG